MSGNSNENTLAPPVKPHVSNGAGAGDGPGSQLIRRTSKSRLSKQTEVIEAEEPPRGGGTGSIAPLQKPPKPPPPAQSASIEGSTLSPRLIRIPQTKISSFDADDPQQSTGGGATKIPQYNQGHLPKIGSQASLGSSSKTLVRSHAMCGDDDTKLSARSIEKQGSSKTCSSAGSSLSRDSSSELYTDSTGVDLEKFIWATLHKNAKDRKTLLELEAELSIFVQDDSKQVHRFIPMSSYNRMLVHRVAAFFGLEHNVDQTGNAVVVSKSKSTRLPEVKFDSYISHENYTDDTKRMLLMRRENAASYDESSSYANVLLPVYPQNSPVGFRKVRSFEEREYNYDQHQPINKPRMFNQDSSSSAEGFIESPLNSDQMQLSLSATTADISHIRPWSSTDSSSEGGVLYQQQAASLAAPMPSSQRFPPLSMQKAGSFGGTPTLYRSDALRSAPPIERSNTDASSENLAGVNLMQSNRPVTDTSMYSPAAPVPGYQTPGQPVIYAVDNIDNVPTGAFIIDPRTYQPVINSDGSFYRYNRTPSGSRVLDPNVLTMHMQQMSFAPGTVPPPHLTPGVLQGATVPMASSSAGGSIASVPQSPQPGTSATGSPRHQNYPVATPQVYTYVVPNYDGSGGSVAPTGVPSSGYMPLVAYMQSSGDSSSYGSTSQQVGSYPAAVFTQAGDCAGGTQVTYTQASALTPHASMAYYGSPAVQQGTTQGGIVYFTPYPQHAQAQYAAQQQQVMQQQAIHPYHSGYHQGMIATPTGPQMVIAGGGASHMQGGMPPAVSPYMHQAAIPQDPGTMQQQQHQPPQLMMETTPAPTRMHNEQSHESVRKPAGVCEESQHELQNNQMPYTPPQPVAFMTSFNRNGDGGDANSDQGPPENVPLSAAATKSLF